MKGEIISTQHRFEVKYEDGGVKKYLHIHPGIETTFLEIGMEVDFEIVYELNENSEFTSDKGWNQDPIKDAFANLTWVPTLYWKIEEAIIKWNIDGTQTAGSLTREIMELIKGETWEEIEEEYQKDEYPVFGGPFTNAKTPWEWLRKYYRTPKRK